MPPIRQMYRTPPYMPEDRTQPLPGLPPWFMGRQPYGMPAYPLPEHFARPPPLYPLPEHFLPGVPGQPPLPGQWGYPMPPFAIAHHPMSAVGSLPVVQSMHHVSTASEPRRVDGMSNPEVRQKQKPNREAGEGEYEFLVEVTGEQVRRTFTARTDMRWTEFFNMALEHIERHSGNIHLGYRISGDPRAMTYLICEYDWGLTLRRVKEKINASTTRAVGIELRNMAQPKSAKRGSGHSNRGGRQKPTCADDIPPESSLATVSHPPNMLKNDFLASRRCQSACVAPEVHVAVNITLGSAPRSAPTPPHAIEVSIVTLTSPIVMQAIPSPSSFPEKVNDMTNTPPYPASPQPLTHPTPKLKSIYVILDCIHMTRVPTTMELLSLMDADHPDADLLYMSVHSELADHGIKDVIDINSLPVELLATFGSLGLDRADRLHQYARDKLLSPLGLLKTRRGGRGGEGDKDDGSIEVLAVNGPANTAAEDDATAEDPTEGGAAGEVIAAEGATVVDVAEVAEGGVTRSAASLATPSASGDVTIETTTVKANALVQRRQRLRRKRDDILQWLQGVTQGVSDIEEVDEWEDEEDDIDEGWLDAELRKWASLSRHG